MVGEPGLGSAVCCGPRQHLVVAEEPYEAACGRAHAEVRGDLRESCVRDSCLHMLGRAENGAGMRRRTLAGLVSDGTCAPCKDIVGQTSESLGLV